MQERFTTELFIKRARLKHGDKYDYSFVDYKNSKTPVKIKCKKHGIFEQFPYNHLRGCGCLKCSGNMKLTKEKFTERAREKFDTKFDYTDVNMVNRDTPVTIGCPEHGKFQMTPCNHLNSKHGCLACSGLIKLNTEKFVVRAKESHGDKYDYSKVVYINLNTKVTITCPKHGDFEQTPSGHLSGKGCNKCGNERRRLSCTSNIEKFIVKAKRVHDDTYDYSKVVYNGCHIDVTIICPKHGDFEQTPTNHLSGQGCNDCVKERIRLARTSNTEDFIIKARLEHGDTYGYDKVVYINAKSNVTITCPKHGDFEQTPNNHLSGKGCNKCGNEKIGFVLSSNTEKFIENARIVHEDKYDYSLVDYINALTYVTIICPKHGDFEQTPNKHLYGQGCPRCINKTEGLLFSILKELFPHYTIPDQVVVCDDGKLKIDFHIVELNLYIELDGEQHFRQVSNWDPPEKTQAHDLTKTKRVLKEGQSLVRIYQPWVASDTNNWLEKLKANIREYEKPMVVFIGPEGIYDKHLSDLHYSDLSNKLYETNIVF